MDISNYGVLTAVFKGVPVKAAAEAARVARIASFIVAVEDERVVVGCIRPCIECSVDRRRERRGERQLKT